MTLRLRIHIFYLDLWWKSGCQNVLSDLDSVMMQLYLKHLGQSKFTYEGHSLFFWVLIRFLDVISEEFLFLKNA